MAQLLTTAEVANRLRISPKTVLSLVERGVLRPVRTSRRTFRYPEHQLDRLDVLATEPSTDTEEGGEQ